MSKPRNKWWGYVKACIREYPSLYQQLETVRREAAFPANGPPRPTEWKALLHVDDSLSESDCDILQGQRRMEFYGVLNAIQETARMRDGPERLHLIEIVFWKQSHTLAGAASICHISERTARRWHGDFIRLTAKHMRLSE